MTGALRMGVAALVALAGCLEAQLLPCGDLVCAAGTVCVEDTVCASPDEIAACDGLAAEAACQSTFGPGRCVLGVCVANVCGDGEVTGIEACDGDALSATCADFGFYEGTLRCSSACVPDPSTCSAYCGDGIVQAAYDEQCDTAPPTDGCLAFGQDYGVLTCNAFCAPAINVDCRRYGWTELLPPPSDDPYTAAAVNGRGAIALNANVVDISWDGVVETRTNAGWTAVAANASVLVAVGPSTVGWYNGQWHELAGGLTANWLTLSDDGYLFAGTTDCALTRLELATGAALSIAAPPVATCGSGVAFGQTELYVSQGSDGIAHWDGASWSTASTVIATAIVAAGPRRLAALASGTTRMVDVSMSPAIASPPRAGGVGELVAYDDDGNELRGSPPSVTDPLEDAQATLRAAGVLFTLSDLEADGLRAAGRSAQGGLFVFGAGVRVMRPLSVATELPIDTSINALHRADDGLIACGSSVFVSGLSGFVERPFPTNAGGCREAAGSATGAHFALGASAVLLYNAGTASYSTALAGTDFTSIAGDFERLWVAGASTISLTSGGSPSVSNPPAGCEILKLAMSPNRTFAGVGRCNGKLTAFVRGAAAWTTVATGTSDVAGDLRNAALLLEVAIGEDDVIVVRHGSDVYRVDGSTLTLVGHGNGIEAVAADDVFIDEGGASILHLGAATSQQLRLASGPFVATATHLFSWDQISRRIYAVTRATYVPGGP